MTTPAHVTIERSVSTLKAAISIATAGVALSPSPPALSKHATPGQIMAALAGRPDYDPRSVHRHLVSTRRKFDSAAASAQDDLNTVGLVADALADAAAYLRGKRQTLSDLAVSKLPADVTRSIHVVKRASAAGIDVPVLALADAVEADSMAVSLRVIEARATLERVKSAGRCAIYNQSEKRLASLYVGDGYSPTEKQKLASLVKSYGTVTRKLKAQHRVAHLEGVEERKSSAKTVGSAIRKQTGIRGA